MIRAVGHFVSRWVAREAFGPSECAMPAVVSASSPPSAWIVREQCTSSRRLRENYRTGLMNALRVVIVDDEELGAQSGQPVGPRRQRDVDRRGRARLRGRSREGGRRAQAGPGAARRADAETDGSRCPSARRIAGRFVTALTSTRCSAFEVHAVDYLLKPFSATASRRRSPAPRADGALKARRAASFDDLVRRRSGPGRATPSAC